MARSFRLIATSALLAALGLNATLTSYYDRMDFGFVGNGVAMYDLTQLARHVRDAYEELKAASSKKRKAPSRATRSRGPKTRRASS